jgi:hypothetical protein
MDPPSTSAPARPGAGAVAARLGAHFARAPPNATPPADDGDNLPVSVVLAARAQAQALYLLSRGLTLPPALVAAIGGQAQVGGFERKKDGGGGGCELAFFFARARAAAPGKLSAPAPTTTLLPVHPPSPPTHMDTQQAQPALRSASGCRPPRVMNAAVLAPPGGAPPPPPLTPDAVAAARRAVEERVKSRLARAAAELGRPTDKLPEVRLRGRGSGGKEKNAP